MKVIHHLTPSRLLVAMAGAIIAGEIIAWTVGQQFEIRVPVVTIGALSAGLAVALVAWLYDGRDDD